MKSNIFIQYLEWYFLDRVKIILSAWKNFLIFYLNYFSIPILLKTLFSPWRRISEGYGKTFNPQQYIEAFVFNAMSRVIGGIIRTCFLIIGVFCTSIVLILGFVFLIIWILGPVLFFTGLAYGFSIL